MEEIKDKERKTATIKIKPSTRQMLVGVGRKNESYDDVIVKLVNFFKEKGGKV